MSRVVGVDLGGTKTAAALVDEAGTLNVRESIPTSAQAGPEVILDETAALVLRLVSEAESTGARVAAIGIGSAGVVDHRTGSVLSATDAIRGWAGTALVHELSARTGLPVSADNDVHAHGIGESWLGACAGAGSALLVAVGTGIGGSLLIDGRPWRGERSVAGHLGHLTVPEADGARCSCGAVGHVEAVGSGPGLHHLYVSRGGDPDIRSARAVVALAQDGDEVALGSVTTAATALGRVIGGLANVLDPGCVVVGGGLTGAGRMWWDRLITVLRAELVPPLKDLPVIRAALGGDAAVLGAARLALDLLDSRSAAAEVTR